MANPDENRIAPQAGTRLPATEAPAQLNDWQALGTAFEGMTKAGLALTIGFSVAAAFCRLVDTGKIKVPDLLGTLARTSLEPPAERRKENGG